MNIKKRYKKFVRNINISNGLRKFIIYVLVITIFLILVIYAAQFNIDKAQNFNDTEHADNAFTDWSDDASSTDQSENTSSAYSSEDTSSTYGSEDASSTDESETGSGTAAVTDASSTLTESKTATTAAVTENEWPRTSVFVSLDGDNNGTGKKDSPYRTIQHAISAAKPGDHIFMYSGVYNEKLLFENKDSLTLQPAPGEKIILSGEEFNQGYLIEISNSRSIVLSGLYIRDFRGDDLECVLIRRASNQIVISECDFNNIGVTGPEGSAHVILAKGDSDIPLSNITISNNRISDCYTGRSEAVTMESNVERFSITGNTICDITNIAIDATGFYDNGVTSTSMNQARNGVIANNKVYNISSGYASCAGIYIDGGRDIIIEKNVVFNSIYGIEIGCENKFDESSPAIAAVASGITVSRNLIYNCSKIGISVGGYDMSHTGLVKNCRINNNTLYNNGNEIEISYSNGISIERNILYVRGDENYLIYHNSDSTAENINLDNNIYFSDNSTGKFKYKNRYASGLGEWQRVSQQDTNSQWTDPKFRSIQNADFSLAADSDVNGYGHTY
jgi:hypothetical protein